MRNQIRRRRSISMGSDVVSDVTSPKTLVQL
jgi:hypothetical protein